MMRRMSWSLLFVTLLTPSLTWAGGMKDALRSVPADAMGVLVIPSIEQLDKDYQQAVKNLGLTEMVPPPYNSLLALVKANVPAFEGLDEAGSVAVVVLPVTNMFEMQQKQVLIIPTKDPRGMVEKLGGTAGEEGTWNVNFMGQPSVAALGEKHITVASIKSALDEMKKSEKKLVDALAPYELEALEGLDFAAWFDFAAIVKIFKPFVDMGLAQAAMQATPGSFEAKQAELSKKELDTVLDGMGKVMLGLALDPTGLGLRFYMNARTGSELAGQMKMVNSKESLLRGLPDGKYLAAFGQLMTEEQAKAGSEQIDDYANLLKDFEGVDAAKLDEIKTTLKDWMSAMRGARGVAEMLTGDNGVIGVALVVETTDGGKWVSSFAGVVEKVRDIIAGIDRPDMAEARDAMKALAVKRDAEDVESVKVHQLSFDLAKMDAVDEADIDDLKKIIGKEGITVRMGAADAKSAVITFGGGKEYFARIAKAVKSNDSALEKQAGIQKASQAQPKERSQVFYFALDRVLQTVNDVMTRMEEEPLPVKVPNLTEPVSAVALGGDGWTRMDIMLPTEVLKAGKDAVMTMMGPGGETGEDGDGEESPE